MRISFLCPHVRIAGGVRAILTYADGLARRGHDVDVIVPAGRWHVARWRALVGVGPEWMTVARASPHAGAHEEPSLPGAAPSRSGGVSATEIATGGFAARVRWVARWDPAQLAHVDVAVATAWESADVVAASAAPAKFYLVQHYESLYHGQAERVDRTYRLPLRKIVISTWLAEIMRERFDRDADLLVTPVDAALFHRVPVDVTTTRPRVLMLHHGYAWKGVAEGLDAVARVKRHVPGLTLVAFGVKPPRERVPYDEFHTNPPQASLASLYSSADIYLCPSWDEGLGMPAMEAMACGAALVTYDNGGCRDYARDGETALVARRRDVGDLAAKLERLATDGVLRARLAAAGHTYVTTAFDWGRAVGWMEGLFAAARSSRRP